MPKPSYCDCGHAMSKHMMVGSAVGGFRMGYCADPTCECKEFQNEHTRSEAGAGGGGSGLPDVSVRKLAAAPTVPAPRNPRMSWDEIWGSMIAVVAKRSTCLRGQVGAAVVTPENRVLAVGYNGAPRGLPHCMDVGCDLVNGHCIRTVHAELNAILNCDVRPKGCVLYTTTYPCYNCAKAIIQSGIREIRYGSDYDDVVPSSVVLDILMAANIYVAPIGV